MPVTPQSRGHHHVELLWLAILVIALLTFLVDAAGWFPDGWLPVP